MMRRGILWILGALLLAACSGSECYDNHSALPLAYFYSSSTRQQVSLNNVEIYGVGAPGDSILYTPQSLREAYLPFRIWEDSTQYVLAYYALAPVDTVNPDAPRVIPSDTITFRYRPKEWFVSPSCGAMYFFDMDTVTHTSLLIDSISYNKVITNENSMNIQIFFREVVADE